MILYRGYDPVVFNSTYNNNSEYILQARINLMDYIERYRAEAQLIQNENFVQGDLVKVLKEYKVRDRRRTGALGSLYHIPEFLVLSIFNDILLLENQNTNRTIRKHKSVCKKIIN